MGIFGNSSPFDTDIEKATNENNTTDQWGLILEICDRVGGSSVNAKECLRSIMRRLGHTDPHVVVQAITLLDACVSNCGKTFHLEVASREFENEIRRLISKHQPQVSARIAGLIKKWAEGEFKSDAQLNLIPSLYSKLKAEGVEFADLDSTKQNGGAPKSAAPLSKDPNVVSSQQEMDDIAKAIELSLKESPMKHATSSSASNNTGNNNNRSSSATSSSSLYPTTSLSGGASGSGFFSSSSTSSAASDARKVRALYDFEAAEDNELSFGAGDIIHVTDDSDPNWWKGYNQRGDGLFPASFVTADLSVEPESLRLDLNQKSGTKKFVQFADEAQGRQREEEEAVVVEINEQKLDRLLHLLHEANPEDPSTDTDEMLALENMVNQMGPLIDAELERVDRTSAQLGRISVGLVDAFNLYHSLMREAEKPQFMGYGQQPIYGHHGVPHQQQMMMNPGGAGMFSPQHHGGGAAGGPGGIGYMSPVHHHNGQFPVVSSGGPAGPMPPQMMMGASASQPGQMPGGGMLPGMNGHPQNVPMAGGQQPQPQPQNGPMPVSSNNPSQALPQQPPPAAHLQQQSQPQPQLNQQMPPNTQVTNSSIGAPITNPGQAPGSNNGAFVPQGPPQQMPQPGGGGGGQMYGQPQPQQFSVAHPGQGMQFQAMPNGGSPQHQQGQGQPQMMVSGGGLPGGVPQMVNFNASPMMMMGGGQPPVVSQMMHPGVNPMVSGAEMNIPIYQQQR